MLHGVSADEAIAAYQELEDGLYVVLSELDRIPEVLPSRSLRYQQHCTKSWMGGEAVVSCFGPRENPKLCASNPASPSAPLTRWANTCLEVTTEARTSKCGRSCVGRSEGVSHVVKHLFRRHVCSATLLGGLFRSHGVTCHVAEP